MDVYTLTPQFFPNVNIDRFFSLIWTERYYDAGDFQLVVPVTPALVSQLAPGTFVALRGLQEIMVVDTLSIDSNSMTVTGSSLVKFLNQRLAWFEDPGYDGTGDSTDGSSSTTTSGNKYADFNTDIETAGQFISDVIVNMVIEPVPFDSPWLSINLDWANEVFPNLSLGNVDDNGDTKDLSFPIGPLFDGLVQVAQGQNIGFKLYLESTDYDTGDHSLKFATYRGKDRTTDQDTFDLVRFSPNLDNFTGVKEIITNMDFKNVAYVTFQNKVTVHYPDWVDPDSPPLDWRRRVIRVDAPDIHLNPGDDRIENFRARVAADTFRHQRGSRSIDGQVLAIDHTYSFPDDYYLGDLVELEGQTGIVKARVIEYIRSQNQYGQTEYPTFDVLHPLDTSFIGDPIFHPPWNDNPVTTGDPPDTPPGGDTGIFTDIPLTPTLDWEIHPGWAYDTDVGYYTHMGVVYIIGRMFTFGDPFGNGSRTLFKNIPDDLRPTSPVSRKVLIAHDWITYEYAYDSGQTVGPWFDITINTNGTITFDDGNPYKPNYGSEPDNIWDKSQIAFILSTISWPTKYASSDTYSTTSFSEVMGLGLMSESMETVATTEDVDVTDWGYENVDGAFAAHKGRLHLQGSYKIVAPSPPGDTVVYMTPENQPKRSSEPLVVGEQGWVEIATEGGYIYNMGEPGGGYNNPLNEVGAQNPSAAGNNGCGYFTNVFFHRGFGGIVTRGQTPDVMSGLSPRDETVPYIGCSGEPVNTLTLSDVARWYGTVYIFKFLYNPDELTHFEDIFSDVTFIDDHDPADDICFIAGLDPAGVPAYYKVIISIDAGLFMHQTLVIMEHGGDGYQVIGDVIKPQSSDLAVGSTGKWLGYSQFSVSRNPLIEDIIDGLVPPDASWFQLDTGASITGNDSNDIGQPHPKGDMGFHIPSSQPTAHLVLAEISGDGQFPDFAPDDTVNFDGCGWPLK